MGTKHFHIGASGTINKRLLSNWVQDTGSISIWRFFKARALSGFLNELDEQIKLPKTIILHLNPSDNELSHHFWLGNLMDGSVREKCRFGFLVVVWIEGLHGKTNECTFNIGGF